MLQKLFGFDPTAMSVKKEVIGGITSFLTMAYILAVNPSILTASGMDQGAVFTTTCIASVLATVFMAIYAKLPYALAPGMGLNAFFAFTICGVMGHTWQFALTSVLLEGLLFLILTVTGLRIKIVQALPNTLRYAISPGIGLFIAFLGLKSAGIISSSESTVVALGNLHDPAILLGVCGIMLTSVLLVLNVTGALLIGIIVTTIIGIPLGITHFTGIFSAPPSLEPILFKFDLTEILSFDMLVCVFTFLVFDIFDTIGTLLGVSQRAGLIDENGNVKHLEKAFLVDALGTLVGACIGTSPVTTYVESASGINVGGRSGLTSFTSAVCFALALFFAPFFLCIPAVATAPALILVGVMMMGGINKIDFGNYLDAIPAFFCIALLPLTNSISDGIMLSVIAYVTLHVCSGNHRRVSTGSYVLAVLFILKYIFL